MKDIVERLRKNAASKDFLQNMAIDLLNTAADEIERLLTELQDRNGRISRLKHELHSYRECEKKRNES